MPLISFLIFDLTEFMATPQQKTLYLLRHDDNYEKLIRKINQIPLRLHNIFWSSFGASPRSFGAMLASNVSPFPAVNVWVTFI